MKIVEKCQAYTGGGDDMTLDHYCMILSDGTEVFKARSQHEFAVDQDVDAKQLDCPLLLIPKEDLWPLFTDDLTLAPNPLPSNTFLKKPLLCTFGDSETSVRPREVILHDAHMCEILRQHPHQNIASYLGCVRDEGLITGLCFIRYKETLGDRLLDCDRPLDISSCLQGVKDGLEHLHSLGLNHNDINPSNIMLDQDDVPVIIDFDNCQREGEQTFGSGTDGWTDGSNTGISKRNNDDVGLMLLYRAFFKDA